MSGAQVAIEAQGLSRSFGRRPVLRSASLVVYRGQAVGIAGPPGAGKTVLLNTLLGFVSLAGGRIWRFPGQALNGKAPAIGYMPQHIVLPETLSLVEFLDLCTLASGVPARLRKQRISSVLQGLGLEDRANLPISQLSTLEQRLAGLAQAVVAQPALLVLDAPTSGLERREADAMLSTITHVVAETRVAGSALLLTARTPQEISPLCDRLLLLDGGALVEVDPRDSGLSEGKGMSGSLRMILDANPAELVANLERLGFHAEPEGAALVLDRPSPEIEQQALGLVLSSGRRIVSLYRQPEHYIPEPGSAETGERG